MKKETTQKSKLWIWIAAAAVLLLAVVGVVLALVLGGQNNGPAVDPVTGPRPDLYWNLDREFYTANSQTGLSTREADANGQFKMRFAYNGEIIEPVIIDKKLVNIIDTQDVLGLTFDENGVVIGQTNVRELATEVGKKIYVKKATADTIIANSSLAMNGMELNLAMGQYAEIYDLRMDSETLGKKLAPTDLQVMDCITVYSNAAGDITHVYLLSNATRSKLYWRANMWVSASVNKGGMVADENGVYTLPYYCEGELLNIKTKDPAMVDHYTGMGKHNGFTGLIFDDDGYAIDIINASVGLAGQQTFYAMDVESVEGNYIKLKNNWSTSGAMNWEGAIPEETPVYDVSSWAYSEGVMGQKISVKDLRVGDRITMFSDMEGNPIEIGITLRRVDLKPMFNNSSKYDAATRSTTRVKDADGYYVYTFIHEKGISKYKTKDQKLANFIDSYPERVFGIVTKGEILVKAYEYECIYGYTRFSTALYVDAINGTILSCSDNKKANAYTAVLAEDYKVLDISGDSKVYGTKIKLQENDCMISFRNTNKEVCMIYVTKRAMGGSLYVNTEPNTSREPITKNDKGEEIKNPYWEFEMTDINGKQVTLKLPTGKKDSEGVYANKYLQSRIDNATRGIIALEVSSKTIKDVHAVGNMASGNSVGTVIITKPGTAEFEYKVAAKPNDEASIYPGWTGKEGVKMINISATIKKYHGEKLSGGMKVNDVYYMVRNRANETVAMFLYGRGLHSDFYFVKNPQGSVNGVTLREPDADGYYVFDVMYQGKATQVRTKDAKLAAKLDGMRSGAALKLDKSKKPYIFTAVADYTGTNDAFKSEVSNWDVSAIKGSNITLKLNIPTATTEVGVTKQLNISGAKIYNISPDAGNNFGKITKLQKNDRIRIFSDKNGKITYVLVTVRNGVKVEKCEHCGKKVTWNPITATSGLGVGDAHYYIFDDYKVYGQMAVSSSSIEKYEVVVDLNGKTVTQDGNNARVFMVAYEGKTLTLMDSVGTGVVQGYGNSPNGEAGNANIVQVSYGGTLNILGGTYKMITAEGKVPAKQGGVIFSWSEGDYARNKVNIKGGTIIGGEILHPARTNGVDPLMSYAWSAGGALYGQKTDFNMSGGTIKDGHADRGGNVYLGSTATFTMTGGTIENGIAKNRGGNFYAATGSKITIDGGKVIGGSIQGLEIPYKDETTGEDMVKFTGQQGGNIFGYNVTLKDGEISGGTARTTGGNIFLLGRITETKNDKVVTVEGNSFTMTGGKLFGGNGPSGGGNIYVYGGDGLVAVSGGEIDASGVTLGPETTTVDEATVVVTNSTLSATGGKIGAVSIGRECAAVVGDDAQIDSFSMNAEAKPLSVAALSKNAKIVVNAEGRFGKAAEGAKNVKLEAYANNQIVSADKQMGNIFVEKDEKGVKWLVAGKKGTVDEIYGSIVEEALKMTENGVFDVKPGTEPAIVEARCPYCKETAQWAPLSEKILKGMTPNDQNSYVLDTHTHYYMAEDVTLPTVAEKATRLNAVKGAQICLHLNAKSLDQNTTASTMGAILVANGATVTIMGDGNVTGAGLTYDAGEGLGVLYSGGAIDARGTVNILGGIYKSSRNDRPAVAAFGAAGTGVKINMYAGTITKGAAEDTSSAFSSNVRMHHSSQTFNMYGGTIEGGMAENGGNLRMHGGTFNLDGGTITNGTSKNLGGNICVRAGVFNLKSGSVTNGTTASSGGSIGLVTGTLNISGGTLSGGKATTGGLVYVYGGKLNVSGGEVKGGTGTNIYIAGGTNTISGGNIAGGVRVSSECVLTVSGDAKIAATAKGLQIVDGAQLLIGELSETASVAVTANGKFATAAEGAENVDLDAYANNQIVAADKRLGTILVETDKDGVKWLVLGESGDAEVIFAQIVADAKKMTADGVFDVAEGAEPAVVEVECPYCKSVVKWAPLTEKILKGMTPSDSGNYVLDNTHYYLAADTVLPAVSEKATRLNIGNGAEICLHLNGKMLNQNTDSSTMGAILVSNGGTLNVMGDGEVTGAGLTYTDANMGALYSGGAIDARGTVNILGGTYKSSRVDRPAVAAFGAAGNGVLINMYAGTITKGAAVNTSNAYSSNVRMHHAKHTFNMYGGTIEGGMAENGGNLRMHGGTFNMYDGIITGGSSKNLGGNICVRGGTFNLIDGEIIGGDCASSGGSIGLVAGALNITGGKISGGTGVNGGLIYVYDGTLAITGGELNDGVSSNAGACVRIAGGTNTITGGTISGGVFVQANCKLTVSDDATIGAQWSGLQIAEGGELLIGKLSKKASLSITAEGKFAKAAEGEQIDLKALIGKQIVANDSKLCTISVVKDENKVEWLSAANKSAMEVYGHVVETSAEQTFTGDKVEAECAYCGKTVTWTGITQAMVNEALTETNNYILDTEAHTHYFLAEDIVMPFAGKKPTRFATTEGTTNAVCLHLNGKKLDQNAIQFVKVDENDPNSISVIEFIDAEGVLFVAPGTTMNIMGNGTVTGTGTAVDLNAGTDKAASWIYSGALDVRGTANIFGGTYSSSHPGRPAVALYRAAEGAAARDEQQAARVVNMFGGEITAFAGAATEEPGSNNVSMNHGSHKFNLYGGKITGGKVDNTGGGNVYLKAGVFTMFGGEITGGQAENLGGNIVVRGGTLNVKGGTISGGKSNSSGGNIGLVSGTINLTGGSITGGNATNGGNIYIYGGNLNIRDQGVIENGVASKIGGNIAVSSDNTDKTLVMTGGAIKNGTAATGGNLHLSYTAQLAEGKARETYKVMVTGGEISGGKGNAGGNVYFGTKDIVLTSGDKLAETDNANDIAFFGIALDGCVEGASGNVIVRDGAKVSATNGGLVLSEGQMIIEGDLSKETAVSVSARGMAETPVSQVNAKMKEYLNKGYFTAANESRPVKVNKDNKLYVSAMQPAIDALGVQLNKERPSDPEKPYHTAVCPACGVNAVWVPLNETAPGIIGDGEHKHYYLTDYLELNDKKYQSASGETVCIYLNGKEVIQFNSKTSYLGAFMVSANSTMNLMGEGTVSGEGIIYNGLYGGGAIDIRGICNLYGGTYKSNAGRPAVALFAASGATLNMYNGKIVGNADVAPTDVSSALRMYEKGHTFNMYGGEISGGKAVNGGNIIALGGTINLYKGKVDGSFYAKGATINIKNGAKIAATNGGLILDGTTINLAKDLAEGTEIYVDTTGRTEKVVAAANDNASKYVNKIVKTVNGNASLKVNDKKQIVISYKTVEDAIKDLTAVLATNVPTGQQYHQAVCPVCGENAEWVPLNDVAAGKIGSQHDHYYLEDALTLSSGKYQTDAGTAVCLFLNGKKLTQSANGIVLMNSIGTTLNIMDTAENKGTVSGGGSSYTVSGVEQGIGALDIRGTCNIYGGTYMSTNDKPAVALFAASNATLNMYGGKIVGNENVTAGNFSNNLRMYDASHTFNMYGGEITGGKATKGANVYMTAGTFRLYSAEIDGGVYAGSNAIVAITNGAKIAATNGGLTVDGTKVLLMADLAAGTEIYLSEASRDGNALTQANDNAEKYLTDGIIKSDSAIGVLKVNEDKQFYIEYKSFEQLSADLHATLATEAPAGQNHKVICPVCEEVVEWVAITNEYVTGLTPVGTNGDLYYLDAAGAGAYHYYLAENVTMPTTGTGRATRFQTTNAGTTVCLYLNDKTLDQNATGSTEGVLKVSSSTTMNIMDGPAKIGTVIGAGSSNSYGFTGGALDARGTVNIYGGTYKTSHTARPAVGLWSASSLVNMYDGKIVRGENVATDTLVDGASNIFIRVSGATFNMHGGEITGGSAINGGNLYMKDGTFNLRGGKISGGAAEKGANVYMEKGTFRVYEAEIDGGFYAGSGIVAIVNGAKVTAANGGLTLDAAKLYLTDDLAAGTEVYLTEATRAGNVLSQTHKDAAQYLADGIFKSDSSYGTLKVNDNNQFYFEYKSVAEFADELSALFATGAQNPEGYCPVCDQVVQWVAITNDYVAGLTRDGDNYYLDAGTATHYYLADDVITMPANGSNPTRFATTGGQITTTCLHLNGKKLDQNTTLNTKMGVLLVGKGTTLNLMDKSDNTGTVIGTGLTASSMYSGALDVRGTANIYGGTYKSCVADRPAVAIFSTSTDADERLNVRQINMYGGVITKGAATTTANVGSSNVWLNAAPHEFNMYGGIIENGIATNGGNLRLYRGTFNMYGGTITGGVAENLGGNVCLRGGTFKMMGGTVKDADITGKNNNSASGGLFGLVSGTLDIQGGVVENGKANYGGLIHVYGGTLKVSGGELKNGVGNGGNINVSYTANVSVTCNITGGTITGGKAVDGTARDVTIAANRTLTLGKDANIEKLYVAGTVTVQNGTVATVELTSAGRIALASDVAEGTEITVMVSATQDIATVTDAANYLTYFKAGVEGATFAVKENTSDTIVMTIPTQG